MFIAGAAVQWLRDGLKAIQSVGRGRAADAATVPDTDGVYLVPAFVGLGAPYWDPYARGRHRRPDAQHADGATSRAPTVDAMAYQTRDVLEAMQAEAGLPLSTLKVDGGAAANNDAAAVPGRPARRAGAPAGRRRDDRARRRLSRRPGRRLLGRPRRRDEQLGARSRVHARDGGDAPRAAVRGWKKAVRDRSTGRSGKTGGRCTMHDARCSVSACEQTYSRPELMRWPVRTYSSGSGRRTS